MILHAFFVYDIVSIKTATNLAEAFLKTVFQSNLLPPTNALVSETTKLEKYIFRDVNIPTQMSEQRFCDIDNLSRLCFPFIM